MSLSCPQSPKSICSGLSGAAAALRVVELVEEGGATAAEAHEALRMPGAQMDGAMVERVVAHAWERVGGRAPLRTSIRARMRDKTGFNVVDIRETGRIPEVPLRREYETHGDHGAVRKAFRLTQADQHKRFTHALRMLHTPREEQCWRAQDRHTPPRPPLTTYVSRPPELAPLLFHISLVNTGLADPVRCALLADGVRACPFLSSLCLAGCGMPPEGAAMLGSALAAHPSLLRLDVSGNRLGPVGAEKLVVVAQRSVTLRHLDVSLNRLGDAGCGAVCGAILGNARSALQSLSVACNAIGAKGGWHLSRLLRDHSCLQSLDAWRNNLGARPVRLPQSGISYMFETLPSAKNLLVLNVTHNAICGSDVDLLVQALRVAQHSRALPRRCHAVLREGNSVSAAQQAELSLYFNATAPRHDDVLLRELNGVSALPCDGARRVGGWPDSTA